MKERILSRIRSPKELTRAIGFAASLVFTVVLIDSIASSPIYTLTAGVPDSAERIAAASPAFGIGTVENGTIHGTVTDTEGAVMAGVQISLEGTTIGTTTIADGTYRLSNLPAGRYAVVAQRIGYARQAKEKVAVEDGSNVQVDFSMTTTALSLEELEAAGTVNPLVGVRAPFTVGAVTADGLAPAPGPRSMMLRAPTRYDPRGESYARIEENRFHSPRIEPLSTFSIDVDRASYSNVRRFLNSGALPPVDAVRIEELVNYFTYDYAEPRTGDPFSVTTDIAAAPWNPGHRLVRIGLKAPTIDLREMPANNLVFLLDVSGSMNAPDKLPLLKQSLTLLARELRPQDRVSIVVYAGAAGLVLPSTPGSDAETIVAALERLGAGGSTAGGAGLRLAYDIARENFIEEGNNRVILATDGDFNVGPSSDSAMIRLIEEEREGGTFLTVLGFGTGNLQDAKMEQIADHGNGNFAYIDNLTEARKVLVSEMGGTLLAVAKDVKIQVEFNPARVAEYRLIGYENRLLATEDFDDDTKDAGEIGAGHTVTALYEIVPRTEGAGLDPESPLRYQGQSWNDVGPDDELLFVKIRYKRPDADSSRLLTHALVDRGAERSADDLNGDFAFAAAVAEFGMLLRDSQSVGVGSFQHVRALAERGLGEDLYGYRAEFLDLVRAAESLIQPTAICEGPNVPCSFGPGR